MSFIGLLIVLILMGWPLAIIFLILFIKSRRKSHIRNQIYDLIYLRRELGFLLKSERIETERYDNLISQVDEMINDLSARYEKKAGDRDAAWLHLCLRMGTPLEPPPWRAKTKDKREKRQDYQQPPPLPALKSGQLSVASGQKESGQQAEGRKKVVGKKEKEVLKKPETVVTSTPIQKTANTGLADESTRFAWKPVAAGVLERAVEKVSGWSKLAVPFMVQNIGWFIGGFFFVSGSVFLVAYTGGFVRSSIIAASLFIYTLLLIAGAYRLLRQRSELRTAGSVLITLGMMLIPISISASVRLVDASDTHTQTTAGIIAVIINISMFYWIAQLGSGIMDRSIQKLHPRLFLLLSSIQIAVPLMSRFQIWQILALLHLVIIGILGYALRQFIQDWLKSIFLDRQKIACYTAGTLVYAALVSFVHLTWRYNGQLPEGYAGPFLMVLAGLLFYVDSHFKEWTKKYSFLSKFTFAVYGLSAAAIIAASNAHWARLITLILGAVVYGAVVWKYLTLPPLYLLIACIGWLYYLIILKFVPNNAYFLTSLPALAGLISMYRFAEKRKAASICVLLFRASILIVFGLGAWSLYHSTAGFMGFITGLLITILLYVVLIYDLRFKIYDFLTTDHYFYLIPISGVITLAYAPALISDRLMQFSMSLILCAGILTFFSISKNITTGIKEKLSNTSICYIFIALIVCAASSKHPLSNIWLIPILTLAAFILAWHGILFRIKPVFYMAVVISGIAGGLFKLTYFPKPSVGLVELLIIIPVWIILLWIEKRDSIYEAAYNLTANLDVGFKGYLADTIQTPLQHAMVVLWSWGMFRLIYYGINFGPSLFWIVSSFTATLTTILLTTYFRLLKLWHIPLIIGLGSVLGIMYFLVKSDYPALMFVSSVYALIIWTAVNQAMKSSLIRRGASILNFRNRNSDSGFLIEKATYQTAYCIAMITSIFAVIYWIAFPGLSVLPALVVNAFFMWATGRTLRIISNSYDVLSIVIFTTLIFHVHLTSMPLQNLAGDSKTGIPFIFAGIFMWALARILDRLAYGADDPAEDFAKSLYRRPLRVAAVILSLVVSAHQIILAIIHHSQGIGFFMMFVTGLAALCLLLSNHKLESRFLNLTGIFLAGISTLWLETAIFHSNMPFMLIAGKGFGDQWLTLAFLSMILAFLAALSPLQKNKAYVEPLYCAAAIGFAWGFTESIWLFQFTIYDLRFIISDLRFQISDIISVYYGIIFYVIQAITLFPLLKPVSKASRWRGLGMLFFLTGFAANCLVIAGFPVLHKTAATTWAFMLWGLANFVLMPFNNRYPAWRIDTGIWLLFGLILLCPISFSELSPSPFQRKGYWGGEFDWLTLSIYLFLLLRNSALSILCWASTLCLTTAGLMFALEWSGNNSSMLVVITLIWANILLGFATFWKYFGTKISFFLKWQTSEISQPLMIFSYVIMLLWMTGLFTEDMILNLRNSIYFRVINPYIPILLSLSFLHYHLLHRTFLSANTFIFSCLSLVLIARIYISMPVLLALWSIAMLVIHTIREQKNGDTIRALLYWVYISPWIAILALIFMPVKSLAETVSVLAIITGIMAVLGWKKEKPFLLMIARLLGLILLHTWLSFFIPSKNVGGLMLWQILPLLVAKFDQLKILFPWYALQLAVVAQINLVVSGQKESGQWSVVSDQKPTARYSPTTFFIIGLALCELALHMIVFVKTLDPMPPSGSWIHGIAAILTAGILIFQAIRHIRRTESAGWVYAVALFIGVMLVYLRFLCVGISPTSIWDTAVLMGTAFGLSVILRFTSSENIAVSLKHLALIAPLAALMTVDFHMKSSHACAAFMAAGAFYISLRHATGSSIALYLGVLSINAAVYLWIPVWAQQYDLIQLYVIPAAVSVLILVHLHRKELKRNVLNSTRLAAVSALYACATLDFFLKPELTNFALAIGLSLVGVAAGIGMRIRAFLYGGTIFMVLNVIGQLIRFYPEESLGKGIFLISLGTIITAGMIWFNIQREAILKRIRIFRADLESWD